MATVIIETDGLINDSVVALTDINATSGKKLKQLFLSNFELETHVTEYSKIIAEAANLINVDILYKEKNNASQTLKRRFGYLTNEEVLEDEDYVEYKIYESFLIAPQYCIPNLVDPEDLKFQEYSLTNLISLIAVIKDTNTVYFSNTKLECISLWDNIILPAVQKLNEFLAGSEGAVIIRTNETTIKVNSVDATDEFPNIPERFTKRWAYDIKMEYLRPDNTLVDVSNYITKFLYLLEFDIFVTPVFVTEFLIPDTVMRDLKNHFENLQFFITVDKFERELMYPERDEYVRKITIINKRRLVALDPDLPSENIMENSGIINVPRHTLKLDFVMYRDMQLNAATQAKVFTNARLIDVIHALFSEAFLRTGKTNDTKDKVKLLLAPPDNNTIYEQIILDPGNLSQNLKWLQEKYGVYQSGIRILFDSTHTEILPDGQEVVSSIVTVTEKGNDIPLKGKIDKIIIEVLDPTSKDDSTVSYFDTGSYFDKPSNTLYLRTQLPYALIKNNSHQWVNGESVRVLGSSQEDHIFSICDIIDHPDSMQHTYWANNDNQYAITQLQDNIKEKALAISISVADVDPLMFNNNLKYFIKFYNKDDEAYSGEYRLKSTGFLFDTNGAKGTRKEAIGVTAQFHFVTIGKIVVEGTHLVRPNYSDKYNVAAQQYTQYKRSASEIPPITQTSRPSVLNPQNVAVGGPFKVAFEGKNDIYNAKFPREITNAWKMSDNIIFQDCYVTKDNTNVMNALGLCERYDLFIHAQRFAKTILDPIVNRFGKFVGGNGKMNSFYRHDYVPPGGSRKSFHLVALAADMALTTPGDALAVPFFGIATSDLDFDQIILEGNGSQWRWIHIQWNANASNRRDVRFIYNSLSGNYAQVNMKLFDSPAKAAFSEIHKIKL